MHVCTSLGDLAAFHFMQFGVVFLKALLEKRDPLRYGGLERGEQPEEESLESPSLTGVARVLSIAPGGASEGSEDIYMREREQRSANTESR